MGSETKRPDRKSKRKHEEVDTCFHLVTQRLCPDGAQHCQENRKKQPTKYKTKQKKKKKKKKKKKRRRKKTSMTSWNPPVTSSDATASPALLRKQ